MTYGLIRELVLTFDEFWIVWEVPVGWKIYLPFMPAVLFDCWAFEILAPFYGTLPIVKPL